jgi:adhesin transport system membrane fusion protein
MLTAEVARLKAEANGLDEIPFPQSFEKTYPNIAQQSRQLFERNKEALKAKLNSLKETKRLSEHELKIIQPLVEKQIISKVEELRLKRKLSQVKGKIDSRKHDFRAEAHRQLTNKKAELAKAKHTMDLSKNKLETLKIRAPTNGIIKRVHTNTKGAAIQPGEKIVAMVPMDKHPIIRAKVRTKDLGYIEKGLPAQVTFSAQSTTQYATAPAKIVYISPDSEKGDDGNLYYEIKLETERDKFKSKSGKTIPIQPGMSVTVAVQVGERTLLGSMLTPLFQTMESALQNP